MLPNRTYYLVAPNASLAREWQMDIGRFATAPEYAASLARLGITQDDGPSPAAGDPVGRDAESVFLGSTALNPAAADPEKELL